MKRLAPYPAATGILLAVAFVFLVFPARVIAQPPGPSSPSPSSPSPSSPSPSSPSPSSPGPSSPGPSSPGSGDPVQLCPIALIAQVPGGFCLFHVSDCGTLYTTMYAACSTQPSPCGPNGCTSPLNSNGATELQVSEMLLDPGAAPTTQTSVRLYSNRSGMAAVSINETNAAAPAAWGKNQFTVSFLKFVSVAGTAPGEAAEVYALYRANRPESPIYKELNVYFGQKVTLQATAMATVPPADQFTKLKPNQNGDVRELAIKASVSVNGADTPVWFHVFGASRR